MSAIFARSFLAPLSLAPHSFSRVHVLLSPAIGGGSSQQKDSSNAIISSENDATRGDATSSLCASQPGVIPASALPALVEQCPSLADGHFISSPHLPTGHTQTIYSTLADTVETEAVHYKRHVLLLPDGGLLSLDVCDNEPENGDGQRPTVVILHGLTGGSQESYVRHCIKHLATPKSEGGPGYRCIVVNFRGCANTPVTSAQLYSAAKTSDFRCGLLYIRQRFPKSPLIGVGFSLGANILSKYLGEEGSDTPLLGGIACAAPYDLKKGSDLMETHTFRRHVYSRAMNGNLMRVASRHAATLDLHEPFRDALDDLLDPQRAKAFASFRGETSAHSSKTLKFVDDVVTRLLGGYAAPYGEFPFRDADHYYNTGGAIHTLKGLQRPLLSLNAEDDPIVAAGSIAGLKQLMGLSPGSSKADKEDHGHTDYIVLATTSGGGHLGWWEGYKKPTRWLHKPVVDFAKALVAESSKWNASSDNELPGAQSVYTSKVLVELMPASLLPPYMPVSERKDSNKATSDHSKHANGFTSDNASKPSTVDRNDPAFVHGARLPWLRTHVLEHAPLLHPSMARQGWCGEAAATSKDFDVDVHGHIAGTSLKGPASEKEDTVPAPARGWCAFEAEMTRSSRRPEVGFLELPSWTRVAGAGEHFQGGREQPGMYGLNESGSGVAGLWRTHIDACFCDR